MSAPSQPSRASQSPPSSHDSSSTSHTTHFTPDADSDDSDIDFHPAELSEGIELERRDVEKVTQGKRARRRGSASTTQSSMLYTPDEERAVVKKFDRRLVLFVALLYMLSFLDRSNIGNARIAGMDEDLGLTSSQYEWILTSFYIAYIVFEWMSLLWKIVPAHIYVAIIVASWGITASLQSCATSFASLIVLRILLGIGEAGFTGIPFFLSFFFRREELALRTGYFISAAPLATSFASSLAWLIIKLGEDGPIASWRLLFLVEGCPSIFIAVIAFNIIPDGPAQATYLTPREKKVARLRLRNERKDSPPKGKSSGLQWREVLHTISDPKAILTALMFFGTNMAFASLPVFLPTIIRSMGFSLLAAQALSAPPYLLSFIAVLLTARASDRLRTRSPFIIFHALLSAAGYLCLALAGLLALSPWVRYAAIYPAAIGFFSVVTLVITWTINNQESQSRQGAGFAMLQIVGQCGPLVGTRLYPDSDAPGYVKGMAVCAVAMVGVAVLAGGLRGYLTRLNRRAEIKEGDEAREGLVGRSEGEKEGRFVYML